MWTSTVEQRVRVAVSIIQAREGERPVRVERLARALPDVPDVELRGALSSLRVRRLVYEADGGWRTRPPPVGEDATSARAGASRLFTTWV